jgi:hypothetical protein
LLVGYVPHHFHATLETKSTRSIQSGAGCALLAPCRRPILIATKGMLFRGQGTSPDVLCLVLRLAKEGILKRYFIVTFRSLLSLRAQI